MNFSVLLADDHYLVLRGLELLVKEVLGENCRISRAESGRQAEEMLASARYDLLLLEINMPDTNGLDLVQRALYLHPDLKIMIVSASPEHVFAARYLKAGALAYVGKDTGDTGLKQAVFQVSQGRKYLSDRMSRELADAVLNGKMLNPFDRLSQREFEVLLLLLKGQGILEVANSLSIGNSTASTYRSRIFSKLDVGNLIELSLLARRYHLVD